MYLTRSGDAHRCHNLISRSSPHTSIPVSLLGTGHRAHTFASRRTGSSASVESSGRACAVRRPASLFVKKSPVPSRRPLRYVPFSSILSMSSTSGDEEEKSEELGEGEEEGDERSYNLLEKPEPVKNKSEKVSKWASLFEAAGGSDATTGSKDSDAWFDKIFPKDANRANAPGASKLSAQQERSIQQLQSLVKTLGVATRNPPPPSRKNRPSKIRPLPVDAGGVVDPVPFASILRKLQSVSSPSRLEQDRRSSRVEEPGRFEGRQIGARELQGREEEEEEEDDEFEEGSSDRSSESDEEGPGKGVEQGLEQESRVQVAEKVDEEEQEQEQVFGSKAAVDEINELAKLTVPTLRGMAKAKGLSGYSRLRKDDLVHLLATCSRET